MSDSISPLEVEDVLSSIRRLVSKDPASVGPSENTGRHQPLMVERGDVDCVKPQRAFEEKLVLTPAQMVAEGIPSRLVLESPVSDLSRQGRNDDLSDETTEPTAGAKVLSLSPYSNQDAIHADEVMQNDPVLDDVDVDVVSASLLDADSVAEQKAEQIGDDALERMLQEVNYPQDDIEPRGFGEEKTAVFVHQPQRNFVNSSEPSEVQTTPTRTREPVQAIDLAAAEHVIKMMAVGQLSPDQALALLKDEVLSSPVAGMNDVQGGDLDLDPVAGEIANIETQETAHREILEDEVLEDDVEVISDQDDDVLRDYIGQMVRQELQGVLGDELSKNLRAMVRREVQTALLPPRN